MSFCCCFYSLQPNEAAFFEGLTGREMMTGPVGCGFFNCLINDFTLVPHVQLQQNEQVLVTNRLAPETTCYRFGPDLVAPRDAWDVIGPKEDMIVLDQDDYIVVRAADGNKRRVDGACVYRPEYGETVVVREAQSIQVPINNYMVLKDNNDNLQPIKHIRGPIKYYPGTFQEVEKDPHTNLKYFPCIEINTNNAIHLQRSDGSVELLDSPQFYMPEVGETVVARPQRIVLLMTDFCIIKSPIGSIFVMNGRDAASRSFFLRPYCEFVSFLCEKEETVLSTLPQFLSHAFSVLTSDNVTMNIDSRISFQIKNVDVFVANPIEYYPYIKNHVQNVLLDKFAQETLQNFMSSFAEIAERCVPECSEFFLSFGIEILEIQILQYDCPNPATQSLLTSQVHTAVMKENELRARQNDIAIQSQSNKVQMKKKDLEVEMSVKDNEVALQKKVLENSIRMKEMDIEIVEENKRRSLLEVKRENNLVEAEFEGKAKGHEFREYLRGVDPDLSAQQKIDLYIKKCDFEQAKLLYAKVPGVTLYPPDADLKMFEMPHNSDGQAAHLQGGVLQAVGAVQSQK